MTAIAALSGTTGSPTGGDGVRQDHTLSMDSQGSISGNAAKLSLSYQNGNSEGVSVTFTVNRGDGDFSPLLPQLETEHKTYRVTVEEVV